MNIEKTLKSIPLFEYLPKKVLNTLAQYAVDKKINKPELIIQSGEPNSNIYFIISGKIKVIYSSKLEYVLERGGFFGEMAIIEDRSQVVHAVPVSNTVEVIYFDRRDFCKCIEAHIMLRTVLTNITAERLRSSGLAGREKSIGNYTILHEIEQSDNGVIFLGEHSILKIPVHIKMLPYQFTQDARYEKRLAGIVKANAHLHNKHIITPIDIINAYGTYFIIYNAQDGISLVKITESGHTIPFRIAVEIILQLADGLTIAHKQNIVHKDLRPENIFIDENGVVMISDFGLTHPDFYNIHYMSPEQIKKTNIEILTDIYSFGIICYKLITNKYPFSGTNAEHITAHKLKADYKSITERDPKIPYELAQLVGRALEPKPDKRLQTLHNIRELLKLWASENEAEKNEKKYKIEEITQDELKKWVHKRFTGKLVKTKKPDKKMEMLYYDFLSLQDIENTYIKYKLVDPKSLITDREEAEADLSFPFDKNKLLDVFKTLEKERQELFIIHNLTTKLLHTTRKYDLIELLKRIIPLAETDNNYLLLSKKEKKIKNQAERELKGTRCKLESSADQRILETAEKIDKPSIIKEKKMYILICPLHTKTKFIGAVVLADKVKTKLETRLGFYAMLAEIIPVTEYKVH
ncbi:MAG: protein kinase [Spirochaetales bacterium]|nr:protein kinase [Spirochaetales bacterium]